MSTPPLDRDALVELLDGKLELIVTIIDAFLDDCSDYMTAIRAAVEAEDADRLTRAAHGLKGATGSLRAGPARDAAGVLEEMGQTGNFAGADAALETLEREIDRLQEALRALKTDCENNLRGGDS